MREEINNLSIQMSTGKALPEELFRKTANCIPLALEYFPQPSYICSELNVTLMDAATELYQFRNFFHETVMENLVSKAIKKATK